jgi:hypothetical protein
MSSLHEEMQLSNIPGDNFLGHLQIDKIYYLEPGVPWLAG